MSLTQYFESQEDQDMTRLLYFTRTQERRREGRFLCQGKEELGEEEWVSLNSLSLKKTKI